MKKYIFLLALLISTIFAFGQNNYIIKKNLGTGLLEVFKSGTGGNSNTPNGAPVMRLKKDPSTGYTIIENLDKKVEIETKINPYNQMPDYSILHYEPYKIDYNALLESINVSNNLREVQRTKENDRIENIKNDICNESKKLSNVAENYLGIVNRNKSSIKLKDGWYNCYSIGNKKNIFPESCDAKYEIWYYNVKVSQNKIIESYFSIHSDNVNESSKIFQKENVIACSEIENFKAIVKTQHNITEFYFMDNLIESESRISNPNFSIVKFDFKNQSDKHFALAIDSKKHFDESNFQEPEYIAGTETLLYFKDFNNTYNMFIYDLANDMKIHQSWRIDDYLPIKNSSHTFTLE